MHYNVKTVKLSVQGLPADSGLAVQSPLPNTIAARSSANWKSSPQLKVWAKLSALLEMVRRKLIGPSSTSEKRQLVADEIPLMPRSPQGFRAHRQRLPRSVRYSRDLLADNAAAHHRRYQRVIWVSPPSFENDQIAFAIDSYLHRC
jgi:hypothetical protein